MQHDALSKAFNIRNYDWIRYNRFTTLGFKDKGIIILEFWPSNQFDSFRKHKFRNYRVQKSFSRNIPPAQELGSPAPEFGPLYSRAWSPLLQSLVPLLQSLVPSTPELGPSTPELGPLYSRAWSPCSRAWSLCSRALVSLLQSLVPLLQSLGLPAPELKLLN